MIELTRDEIAVWLNSPITKGLYNAFLIQRDQAEDNAFNATISNYEKNTLTKRNREELFAYVCLEVLNKIVTHTFLPLYEDLKNGEKDPKIEETAIDNFIHDITEALKYVDKRK